MRNQKIVDIPYSQSAVLAGSAPSVVAADTTEHIFFRLDVVSRPTATGGLIFVAASPQFPNVTVIDADKNGALYELLERLPQAFWEEKTKMDRAP